MVLDEASPTAAEFMDDKPPDDSDTLSAPQSNGGGPQQFGLPPHINLNSLSRPLPVLGPLMGYNESYLIRLIRADSARISAIVQRPLRPEEWDASAQTIGKLYSTNSFGPTIGVLFGWLRADQTKAEFRFPFFKPDLAKFDFQSLPGTSLKGPSAVSAWHWLRRFCYLCVSVPAAKLIITSYALSTFVVSQYRDPRLKDMWSVMQSNSKDEVKRRARSAGMGGTGRQPVQVQQGQWQYAQDQQSPDGASSQQRNTSRPFGDDVTPSSSSDSLPQGMLFDDASPTAGNEPLDSPSVSQGESAWDRVRRGGRAPQAPQDRPAQTQRVTGGDAWSRIRGAQGSQQGQGMGQGQGQDSFQQDSYSFSSRESDRHLASDDAQYDFNAKLDRERRGSDFGSDVSQQGGANSGWRR